jgi:hypothetical protein
MMDNHHEATLLIPTRGHPFLITTVGRILGSKILLPSWLVYVYMYVCNV